LTIISAQNINNSLQLTVHSKRREMCPFRWLSTVGC